MLVPPIAVVFPAKVAELVVILATGVLVTVTVDTVPVILTSSIRIAFVPVFTNRILRPLIWASAGNVKAFDTYHPAVAPALSLNSAVDVLAIIFHEVPFQYSTEKVA